MVIKQINYRNKLINTMNESQRFKNAKTKLNNLEKSYPFLLKCLSSLNAKEDYDENFKNGNRLDDELKPICILFSFSGE